MSKVLIVTGVFYRDIADTLLAGARKVLDDAGVDYDEIEVPGAFEIPAVISMAAEKYDGFVALGCVIRGETTHYDYVCGESARALMDLTTQQQLPIGYGILTVENRAQAEKRAGADDKGGCVTQACLEMMAIKERFA